MTAEKQAAVAAIEKKADLVAQVADEIWSFAELSLQEAFDGRGNYALGIKEQIIFPEIEYDKVDKVRGMDIIIVTTAKTDEEARELLTLFNMPFAK